MKNPILLLFLLLSSAAVVGCGDNPNKDGWIVKAQNGKYYQLVNPLNFGDKYFLKEIDTSTFKFIKP